MSEAVRNKIIQIIATQALIDPSKISEKTVLSELGIDSLGLVEVIFSIEETFNISIPFNSNNPENSKVDFSNISSIVLAVKKQIDLNAKPKIK